MPVSGKSLAKTARLDLCSLEHGARHVARPRDRARPTRSQGGGLQRRRFDADELGFVGHDQCAAPANLTVIVFDNGVYEVTGAQPTAAAPVLRPNSAPVDFAALAQASGFTRIYTFDAVEPWRDAVGEILSGTGPTFVQLQVEPMADAGLPAFPGPAPDRALALRAALKRAE